MANQTSNATEQQPDEQTRRVLREVARRDRAFFETYPRQPHYSRPYVRGEAWPLEVDCRRVMVARHPGNPDARMVIALGDHTDDSWPQFDLDRMAPEEELAALARLLEIARIAGSVAVALPE